jgi:hypothetical protein
METLEIDVPQVKLAKPSIKIDLALVREAENRIGEIATVNKHTAPELLSVFNKAFLKLTDAIAKLKLDHHAAKKEAKKIQSRILLDEVADIVKKKGLDSPRSKMGAADIREAILGGNDEYQDALDKAEVIRCAIELLEGKKDSIEMAYTAVKKVISDPASLSGSDPNRSGGITHNNVGGQAPDEDDGDDLFGHTRYS